MKRFFVTTVCFFFFAIATAQDFAVYPTHWWVNMKNPNLQLMLHGKAIANSFPQVKMSPAGVKIADGVTLKAIHRVANPNYIFLDLVIASNATPGVKELKIVSGNT
ncbi:MAG: alpha-amylase, partial [Gammaproteobacteria bacterium]